MLTAIYIILIILNFLCLFFKKRCRLLLIIDFIFTYILFCGTTKNADYDNYRMAYNAGKASVEKGFAYFMLLCKNAGLTYNQFVGIIWIISGLIYVKIFSKYSKNYEALFLVYYIFFVFVDVVQIRSFFATSLLCMSLYYYFNDKKIKSIIWLSLSVFIHTQVIFFAPLIIIINPNMNVSLKFLKRFSIAIMVFCIINVVLGSQNNILINSIARYILDIFNLENKADGYLLSTTRFGGIFYILMYLYTIISFRYMYKSLMSTNISDNDIQEYNVIYSKIYLLQLYCAISFPLIMININFYRFYRMTFLFNAIIYGILLTKSSTKNKSYYLCLFWGLSTFLIFRNVFVPEYSQIEIILQNNMFFE